MESRNSPVNWISSTISLNKRTLRLNEPLHLHISYCPAELMTKEYYICENKVKGLESIEGIGFTKKDAIEDFKATFFYFYDQIFLEKDEKLSEDEIGMKQALLSLVKG